MNESMSFKVVTILLLLTIICSSQIRDWRTHSLTVVHAGRWWGFLGGLPTQLTTHYKWVLIGNVFFSNSVSSYGSRGLNKQGQVKLCRHIINTYKSRYRKRTWNTISTETPFFRDCTFIEYHKPTKIRAKSPTLSWFFGDVFLRPILALFPFGIRNLPNRTFNVLISIQLCHLTRHLSFFGFNIWRQWFLCFVSHPQFPGKTKMKFILSYIIMFKITNLFLKVKKE